MQRAFSKSRLYKKYFLRMLEQQYGMSFTGYRRDMNIYVESIIPSEAWIKTFAFVVRRTFLLSERENQQLDRILRLSCTALSEQQKERIKKC